MPNCNVEWRLSFARFLLLATSRVAPNAPNRNSTMKIMIIGGSPEHQNNKNGNLYATICEQSVSEIAKHLVADGHELIVCSPYYGSADHAALQGIASTKQKGRLEFHYPDVTEITKKVEEWADRLPQIIVDKFPHHPPETDSPEALQHAWLLSQLSALDRSSALISIGGRIGASAELLLKLAHSRGRLILPFTVLKGASARFFDTHRYEYDDLLGDEITVLQQNDDFQSVSPLLAKITSQQTPHSAHAKRVFVSYAREQSSEADFVEMTLRRRGIDVVRDEAAFEPGHSIPDEIREKIFSSQVFIGLWSNSYHSNAPSIGTTSWRADVGRQR